MHVAAAEKRLRTASADASYRTFFEALEGLDPQQGLDARTASRLVSVLSSLLARHQPSPTIFAGLIGHGATLREVFAKSGFSNHDHLVSLVATRNPNGDETIDSVEQLEKLLCLASVEHTPTPLLGMIPKLRSQAALQVCLHLLSDEALASIPSLLAFVLGLCALFAKLEVSDELIPAFGPAFAAAPRFEGGTRIQSELQAALGRWRASKGWPDPEPGNPDGPDVIIAAEPVDSPASTSILVGPFESRPGFARTVQIRPRVRQTAALLKQLRTLAPRSVTFAGHATPWWLLVLSQIRWAATQTSRHVDLRVEATTFAPTAATAPRPGWSASDRPAIDAGLSSSV